jgi:hypothetical protein
MYQCLGSVPVVVRGVGALNMRNLILLVICFTFASAALANPVYRWVDAQGVTNYTNDQSKVPKNVKAVVTSGDEIYVLASDRSSAPARAPAMGAPLSGSSGDILSSDERAIANQWRAAFREVHARIARLEFEVRADKQLVDDPGRAVGRVASYRFDSHPRWTLQPDYLQAQTRLEWNLGELWRARADLEELERAASREAVPREWRQP